MGWVRRAGVLVIVVAISLALGTTMAGAKKKHHRKRGWRTKVTLTQTSSTQFTGKASSKLGACKGMRLVTLYYTNPTTLQTQPLSVQRTGGKGKYEVDLTAPAFTGSYYVTVDKRKVRAMGAKQTCKASQSRAIGFEGTPPSP